jgi:hypothetical protein
MARYVLLGNSGSGKSTLGARLNAEPTWLTSTSTRGLRRERKDAPMGAAQVPEQGSPGCEPRDAGRLDPRLRHASRHLLIRYSDARTIADGSAVDLSFSFSWLGTAYLAMLFVPNLLWARLRNERADTASPKENSLLIALERVGQAGTTIAALVAPESESPRTGRFTCLAASFLAMILYELSWLRYFRSDRTAASLYRSLGPVPLPLAVLPVLGFLLLAVFEVHLPLLGAVVVLGIGHVGIHWNHARRLR